MSRLDQAESSEPGRLLRRALDLQAAARIGIQLTLNEVAADEFQALILFNEENERWSREHKH